MIGYTTHPYCSGGQSIGLAMMNTKVLCDLLTNDITEEVKVNFQTTRVAIAKAKDESSEKRNKPENQITTKWGFLYQGLFMKAFHLFKGSKMEL